MPRLPRQTVSGEVYHLISRFVDRNWYITREDERANYLRLLGRAVSESDWRCLSYGVMSNHIHLGMVAGHQPLDAWIRRVHAPFADWMNRTYDRIGVMFVRGPKAILTQADEVGELIAYIHNNPVRAGVVTAAGASTWTSHRAYVGLDPAPAWLSVDEGLARAGFRRDPVAFDRWVAVAEGDPARFEPEAGRGSSSTAPRHRAVIDVLPPSDIVTAAADEVGVPVAQLRSRRRGAAEVAARMVVVHCAAALGVTGRQIAGALGMSQQGVSVIARRRIEDDVRALSQRVLERLAAGGTRK